MRVLLTGSAGFIGTAIGDRLEAEGDEVVSVDLMLDSAHGATTPPAGTHQLDVREAASDEWAALLSGVDVVCHQAALVGAGVRVGDLPAYAGHNDLGTAALLAAMHDAGVGRLVLASSMVVYGEGRYACPDHGPQVPGPSSGHGPRRRRVRQPLPGLRGPARLGAGRRGRSARPAQQLRRQQARPGALHVELGPPGRRRGHRAALPQRLRSGDAARHSLLRGRRHVPLLPRAGRAAAGLRGRRPDARLRARLRHRSGQRGGDAGRGRRGGRSLRGVQRLLGSPGLHPRRGPPGGGWASIGGSNRP